MRTRVRGNGWDGREKMWAGGDVLSHPVSRAVPSALRGLTAVFGMGTGVSPAPWPPTIQRLGCGIEQSTSSSVVGGLAASSSGPDPWIDLGRDPPGEIPMRDLCRSGPHKEALAKPHGRLVRLG